jgi:hypothetical protein
MGSARNVLCKPSLSFGSNLGCKPGCGTAAGTELPRIPYTGHSPAIKGGVGGSHEEKGSSLDD